MELVGVVVRVAQKFLTHFLTGLVWGRLLAVKILFKAP